MYAYIEKDGYEQKTTRNIHQKHRNPTPTPLDQRTAGQVAQVAEHAAMADDTVFNRQVSLVDSVRADKGEDVVENRLQILLVEDGDVVSLWRKVGKSGKRFRGVVLVPPDQPRLGAEVLEETHDQTLSGVVLRCRLYQVGDHSLASFGAEFGYGAWVMMWISVWFVYMLT